MAAGTSWPGDGPVTELADRLSIAGFEVEQIEDLAASAAGVVVGQVLEKTPHPQRRQAQCLPR